jgi:hypothetical protein
LAPADYISVLTAAQRTMDKQLQIVQLCLPLLTPKEVCMQRCTCSEFRDMRVSWKDHSIRFELDDSISAASWLHKNIVSMVDLTLNIITDMPARYLQDVLKGGK